MCMSGLYVCTCAEIVLTIGLERRVLALDGLNSQVIEMGRKARNDV